MREAQQDLTSHKRRDSYIRSGMSFDRGEINRRQFAINISKGKALTAVTAQEHLTMIAEGVENCRITSVREDLDAELFIAEISAVRRKKMYLLPRGTAVARNSGTVRRQISSVGDLAYYVLSVA